MADKKDYNFKNCGYFTFDSIIPCEEKGRRFEAINKERSEILKIRLEYKGVNCLGFKGEVCDFLLINLKTENGFFIELKGSDLEKAFSQITNSIREICNLKNKYLKRNLNQSKAYIVLSRYPKFNKFRAKYEEILRRDFNTKVFIGNKIIKENIG